MFLKHNGIDSLDILSTLQLSNLSHAKLSDFPKVTQLESGKATEGTETEFWLSPVFFLKALYKI